MLICAHSMIISVPSSMKVRTFSFSLSFSFKKSGSSSLYGDVVSSHLIQRLLGFFIIFRIL
jgi:hypothetical protein